MTFLPTCPGPSDGLRPHAGSQFLSPTPRAPHLQLPGVVYHLLTNPLALCLWLQRTDPATVAEATTLKIPMAAIHFYGHGCQGHRLMVSTVTSGQEEPGTAGTALGWPCPCTRAP